MDEDEPGPFDDPYTIATVGGVPVATRPGPGYFWDEAGQRWEPREYTSVDPLAVEAVLASPAAVRRAVIAEMTPPTPPMPPLHPFDLRALPRVERGVVVPSITVERDPKLVVEYVPVSMVASIRLGTGGVSILAYLRSGRVQWLWVGEHEDIRDLALHSVLSGLASQR